MARFALDLTGPAGDLASPVHRRDPRAKILGLFGVTVVAVSVSPRQWPVWVACAAVLVALAATARVPPGVLWRRGRIVLAPVIAVALVVPLVRSGGETWSLGPLTVHEAGLEVLAGVAAKALIGTFAAVLFGCTTTFPAALRGLEALHVPRVLVLIAQMMYRYLFVLVEELGRLRLALAARAYKPRTALQAAALGRAATSLFLRSHARGERVHLAMRARGYNGRMPYIEPLAFARADALFVAAVAVALVPVRAVVAL
jgi:cobalt/nickel transport system permease protein